MSHFNPEKLTVEYTGGTAIGGPITPRCYTLTHSDETGELFLTIGKEFAWGHLNPMRDEVLGEWRRIGNGASFIFTVFVYIDQGEWDLSIASRRNDIFRRELPLALKAIKYGDRFFFNTYSIVEQSPIIVHFISLYPQLAKQENWGAFQQFAA